MELARKEAFSLIGQDPELKQYENRLIRENLLRRFEGKMDLVKIA